MGIDLQNEKLLSLSQAAKLLPSYRRERPVSLSCLLRWVLDGVRTPNGVIRLEAVRMGGRWITSAEALERFAAAQTPTFEQPTVSPRALASRQQAVERADRRLESLGI
jgi:hypothetical protein